MAKVVDISDKLAFGENPEIVINGERMEVNADAETVLRLMGTMSGPRTIDKVMDSLNLLFGENNVKKICAMTDVYGRKLKVSSLMAILEQAVSLAMGGDSEGE